MRPHQPLFILTMMYTVAFAYQAISVAGVGAKDLSPVLIEAESFENPGGWVVDQQFMDQMGSPFLLAHGLGVPVQDAVTAVTLPAAGKYRVWVRTRDWAGARDAQTAPGKFQVLVDGQPLAAAFGTEGAAWHWQDGGTVEIRDRQVKLALHDLTGFEGRCDAILFSRQPDFVPPDRGETLANFRRDVLGLPQTPQDAGRFDLVVVGGGMAGTCTAISAARLGLQVALVQDRPVLGGNNSSEVRVHLNGQINLPPYPRIGDVVGELDSGGRGNAQAAALYDDEKKLDLVRAESNIHLFLDVHAYQGRERGQPHQSPWWGRTPGLRRTCGSRRRCSPTAPATAPSAFSPARSTGWAGKAGRRRARRWPRRSRTR